GEGSLVVGLVLINAGITLAQDTVPEKSWHLEVGPMVTVPIRYLHYYSVLGLGAEAAANAS
ncbi:MAG: hypothetical protein ABIO46_08890, partial [Chitinophagales bacterium]